MNKDIQKVENALDCILEINRRNQNLEATKNFENEKSELQKFLYNLPQVTFQRMDIHCSAFIDGIHFYFEPCRYSKIIIAEHKIVRRFLWKRWVAKRKHKFSDFSKPLSWVLNKHLEALKFEANVKNQIKVT